MRKAKLACEMMMIIPTETPDERRRAEAITDRINGIGAVMKTFEDRAMCVREELNDQLLDAFAAVADVMRRSAAMDDDMRIPLPSMPPPAEELVVTRLVPPPVRVEASLQGGWAADFGYAKDHNPYPPEDAMAHAAWNGGWEDVHTQQMEAEIATDDDTDEG